MVVAKFQRGCCITGYHYYRAVWIAVVGESLEYVREPMDELYTYMYAVAAVRNGTVVGHFPWRVDAVGSHWH